MGTLVRTTIGILLCGLVISPGQNASATTDLKSLYEGHQWFELREAMAGKQGPALYRGAVAAAFNKTAEAQDLLQPLIDSSSTPDAEAEQAAQWLSYVYLRAGQYQKAVVQVNVESSLGAMLRTLPDQSISSFQQCAVTCRCNQRKLFVPISIKGKAAEFFIDSDANFSFMSESEARNLGLTIHGTDMKVQGAAGTQAAFRTAVADELTIGSVQLRNVSFLVLADAEEVFPKLPLEERGALGLPVLLALRTVRFNSEGKFEIGFPSESEDPDHPTLCFDGPEPIVKIGFEQQQLPAVLDTGAEVTEIWPPFAMRFADVVNASGKKGTKLERGVGGRSQVPERVVPELTLQVGGFEAHVHPAHVLLASTTPNSQWFYARLGLDVLRLAHQVTIDFTSLTVRLQ